MSLETAAVFVIISFCLGAVLLMSKDNISSKFKKWLALWAIICIVASFAIIIYSLFTMGSP